MPAFIAIDTSCSEAPTPGPDEGSDTDVLPGAATPVGGSDGSGSDSGDGSNGGSGGGSDGDVSDGPTSGDGDTESGGGSGSSDGSSNDDSDGGDAGTAQDGTSGGLSDTLIVAIVVAGAAIIAGFVMFGLRRWWAPVN